jgi:hypothetical protein
VKPPVELAPVEYRRVVDAVAALGATADEVADTLQRAGIAGVPLDPTRCPIARYVDHRFPGLVKRLVVSTSSKSLSVSLVSGPIPGPVGEFIDRFDHEEYPDLIEKRNIPPATCPEF